MSTNKKRRSPKRRSTWTPAQGVARFAITTAQAAAAANPSPLTDDELAFLFGRLDEAMAALWRNEVDAQHILDLCEALNVTQALVDAGAAPECANDVVRAIYAGAAVRNAWDAYTPGGGLTLASLDQIEAIQAGLAVHKGILEAGLYGHELLQAMDIMRARQRAGYVVTPAGGDFLVATPSRQTQAAA